MFWAPYEYIYGSKAADQYRAISRHDYEETGKTWPPSGASALSVRDETDQWRQFIETYPWFPGTDDAYYRLAFSQFVTGKAEAAIATINEFLKADLPDHDAEPYVMYLLRAILVTNPDLERIILGQDQLRAIATNPLGPAVFNGSADVARVVVSSNWLLQSPGGVRLLNSSPVELSLIRDIATMLQSNPHNRTRTVQTLLRDRPDLLPAVLYSQFFRSDRAMHSDFSGTYLDPSDEAMAWVALRLTRELSSARLLSRVELADRITWALLHFHHRTFRDNPRFNQVFKLTAAVDTKELPPNLRDQHREFVFLFRGGN